MHRILLLDDDHPDRALLVDSIHRTLNTDCVIAAGPADLIAKVSAQQFAAVFIEVALLGDAAPAVMNALRSASPQPLVIFTSSEYASALDPDLVSLVVRKPYDVPTVTGILLSAMLEPPADGDRRDQRRGFDA